MTKPIIASYGNWKSPITADLITAQSISLEQVTVDGETIYWSEGRPNEDGRIALMKLAPGHPPSDCLTGKFSVGSRVHEYGGGAFAVSDGDLYFVDFHDQHLYLQSPGGVPERISRTDGYRYADLVCDSSRERLICIREDHTKPGQVTNTIVAMPFGGGKGHILVDGYDFFSTARLSPDGMHMAWVCWNRPNMSWDGCELWVADVREDGTLWHRKQVAGGKSEAIFQPEWSPAGILYFVSDRGGWWNLYRVKIGVECLYAMEAEFGVAQWFFAMRTYTFLSESEILCTFTQNGMWKLARLDTGIKQLLVLDLPYTDITDLHTGLGFAVFIGGSPQEPTALIKFNPITNRTETLRRSFKPSVVPSYFSLPETVEFPTEKSLTSHGIFYPPANPDYIGPLGEHPLLLVMCHGGPTLATSTTLRYTIQYWTSRGFAVLDVNYGGSTGYGRAYRERLNGNWGIVDVDDCCNGARWLVEQGRVDAERMAISGGSAGGFTTLSALLFKDVFSAGACYYGISDPEALAKEMHKFESRYFDHLIGPYPERKDLYLARSPLHNMQKLATPLLLLQGDSDPIVPPNQTEHLFQIVRKQGVPVAFLLLAGEGHGFRKAENIKRSFEAELCFYSKIFDLNLVEPIDPIRIENLE